MELLALRAELRTSLEAVNAKIDRLLVVEKQVQEHSQAIARIKTLWSVLAAGIALAAATLKDWILWLVVHIVWLIGFRNRFLVLSEWAWTYLRYERGARLITGEVGALLRPPAAGDGE